MAEGISLVESQAPRRSGTRCKSLRIIIVERSSSTPTHPSRIPSKDSSPSSSRSSLPCTPRRTFKFLPVWRQSLLPASQTPAARPSTSVSTTTKASRSRRRDPAPGPGPRRNGSTTRSPPARRLPGSSENLGARSEASGPGGPRRSSTLVTTTASRGLLRGLVRGLTWRPTTRLCEGRRRRRHRMRRPDCGLWGTTSDAEGSRFEAWFTYPVITLSYSLIF